MTKWKVFWVVTSRSWGRARHFGILEYSCNLKMEAIYFSKTSGSFRTSLISSTTSRLETPSLNKQVSVQFSTRLTAFSVAIRARARVAAPETNSCLASHDIRNILCNPKVPCRLHKSPSLVRIQSQVNPFHSLTPISVFPCIPRPSKMLSHVLRPLPHSCLIILDHHTVCPKRRGFSVIVRKLILIPTFDRNKNRHAGDVVEYAGLFFPMVVSSGYDVSSQVPRTEFVVNNR
jgi:hypothetical protein